MHETIYRTNSIIPEYRDKIPNRTEFDVCEDCNNVLYKPSHMSIRFREKYKLVLCDACVDCRDGLKWKNAKDFSNLQK